MMLFRLAVLLFITGFQGFAVAAEPVLASRIVSGWGMQQNSDMEISSARLSTEKWWSHSWGTPEIINPGLTWISEPEQELPANLSLGYRWLSALESIHLRAGVGIDDIGLDQYHRRNGLSLSLGGQFSTSDTIMLYGKSTWLPGSIESQDFSTLSGLNFETGIILSPLPFISVRAAYRRFNLDYTLAGEEENRSSQGIIIGTGIHW